MKIKTITCHDVYNYGASLQAYALQKYLEMQGHNVEIIDYLPEYLTVNYRVTWGKYNIPEDSKLYRHRNSIPFIKLLYRLRESIKKILFILDKRKRKVAFDCFKRKYLKTTERTYTSIDDFHHASIDADVVIAGSDQIWNPIYENGRDPVFFLQFATCKRVAYAASFGVSDIPESDKINMSNWLNSFDCISVRENTGLNILTKLGIENGIQVCDPVFLLSKDEWLKVSSSRYNYKKYILVYNLGGIDDNIKKCALTLSRCYGLDIVSVEERGNIYYANHRIKDAGPAEFIELFSKASFVVTNSFHATSFSLMFNIPFYTFINNKTSSRVSDILNVCGLQNRLNPVVYTTQIDWTKINASLKSQRIASVDFLKKVLTCQ